MRPLSLQVSGFTCFRERQTPLDFSRLELFAITGPTGGGKSSVLDAMTYALYGKVPRMGRGSVKDLISHGCDRMTVLFEFSVHQRRFLVTRCTRRNGASAVQMDELHEGTRAPLAEGARQVQMAVTHILGLDYDAFTQAVMLPQGEFARFLKGDRAERRLILQELLRLTVYGRMRELASERCKDAKRIAQMLEQQLQAYVLDTPDMLAQLERERARLVAARPALQEARAEARARRDALHVGMQRAAERARRRAERDALDAQQPAHEARLLQVERSRRAREVQRPLEQLAREQARYTARPRDAEAAARRLEACHDAVQEAAAARDRAHAACAAKPSLTPRIEALRAVQGRIQHRDSVGAECEALAQSLAVAQADLARKAQEMTGHERRARQAAADRANAEASLAHCVFDETELAACEGGRDVAREIARDRQELPALEARVRAAIAARDQALRDTAAEEQALDEARATCERLERERLDAVARLQAAQDVHRAMTLRSHLAPGHTCPVCEQPVAVVPPLGPTPGLAELLEALDETSESRRTADLLLRRQQEAYARSVAAAEGAARGVTTAEHRREETRARVADGLARLKDTLGLYLPPSAASMSDHWLLERLEVLRALQTQRDACERQGQILRAAAVDAEHALTLARQAHASGDHEVRRRREDLEGKHLLHQRLSGEVAAVTTAADPRAELASLVAGVQRLDAAMDEARSVLARHEMERVAAAEALQHAEGARSEAAGALNAIAAGVADALAAFGFATADDARGARLPAEDEQRLVQECEQHATQRALVLARLAELEAEIGPSPATEAQLAEAEADADRAEQALDDNAQGRAALDLQVTSTRQRLDESDRLRVRHLRARADLGTHGRLASDLQANAFQDWLLAEVFDRIVQGASTRLMELTSRYTLDWADSEFHVVDHDNARERRTADTLSGGETFLASLALALELSEQVQRAAGAVRLDSLFIDEGFGSLDASALDVVATAMESLQVTGRMIGIITHIRELTDRMPAAIAIDKHPNGSRWSIVGQM